MSRSHLQKWRNESVKLATAWHSQCSSAMLSMQSVDRHNLFIGYNFADPDFRSLFNQVTENRFAHIAYGVYPGLQEVDVRMWRDRGIIILNEDPLGILD